VEGVYIETVEQMEAQATVSVPSVEQPGDCKRVDLAYRHSCSVAAVLAKGRAEGEQG
jgi:hypothetical protein